MLVFKKLDKVNMGDLEITVSFWNTFTSVHFKIILLSNTICVLDYIFINMVFHLNQISLWLIFKRYRHTSCMFQTPKACISFKTGMTWDRLKS